MHRFKLHIAYFLLTGFLFPLVANAVHYFVQSHSLSPKTGETYNFAVPPYDYHVCDYQFNSLKYYIITNYDLKPSIFAPRERQEKYFYTDEFVTELAFHYSLRGPPTGVS
ncbi:MAG: hypothetical protein R6W85_11940 [Gillisia sp.]